ncbi:DUF4340 domain-containing protein [bacterium]|nr:DUF4340 domain-containing protein [bacterium]
MSRTQDQVRRRTLIALGSAAAASVATAAVAWAPSGSRTPTGGALAAPELAVRREQVRLIMVTTKDEVSHLVREDSGWVLTEKGLYPVSPAIVPQLLDAVAEMRLTFPMTTDQRKFDRIGLGDPLTGGSGALVEIGDGQGEVFATLIIGRRTDEVYARRPDDVQAWRTEGPPPPPLMRSARWLDLDVLSLQPGDIAEVEVAPLQGPAYTLLPRDEAAEGFRLAPPHDARPLVSEMFLSPPALSLAEFAPVDVLPAERVRASGAARARQRLRTRSGVTYEASGLLDDAGRGWVTLQAAAGPDVAGFDAVAFNERVGPWAFQLGPSEWATFNTPLSTLLRTDR